MNTKEYLMNIFKIFPIFLFMLLILASCNYQGNKHTEPVDREKIEASLIEANKKSVMIEDGHIEDYIQRKDWKMQKTGTGLRYKIYDVGDGDKAVEGKVVALEYSVQLINGDLIYSSDNNGLKEFLIGKGGVGAGLEEGILLLREGDSAKFILPSHLGFGLTGDGDKIPPKSTLIYNVKLLTIKR